MIRFTTRDGVWHEVPNPTPNDLPSKMRLFRYSVLTRDHRFEILKEMEAHFERAFGEVPLRGTDIAVTDAFEARTFVSFGRTIGLDDEFELPEGVVIFPVIDEDGSPKIIARCPDPETAAFLVLSL